jgi:hypothetical protein
MTQLRTMALRVLLAVLIGSMVTGCLPVGFRGSSLYVGAPAPAGH